MAVLSRMYLHTDTHSLSHLLLQPQDAEQTIEIMTSEISRLFHRYAIMAALPMPLPH